MIIRMRINDVDGSPGNTNGTKWTLYSVPDNSSLQKVFDSLHSQELKPHVDIFWADTDSCKYFIASTTKELPTTESFMETSGEIAVCDLNETQTFFPAA